MNRSELISFLNYKAYLLRLGSLRATTAAGSGHLTSALSAADMVAALFFYAMKYDPYNPDNICNDSFILSKGHASPILYSAWWQAGVISESELLTLRTFSSKLEGHPSVRFDHVAVATGSLGCGLAIGLGQALAALHENINRYTYVLMGDGECAEGSVWEAAQLAAHYNADHIIALIDCNGFGQSEKTLFGHSIEEFAQRFTAFGWHSIMCDGHDMNALVAALDQARAHTGSPTVIIARTLKGYGLPSIQDKNGWHGKVFSSQELPEKEQELKQSAGITTEYKEDVWNSIAQELLCNISHEVKLYIDHCPEPVYHEAMTTRKAFGQALVEIGKQCASVIVIDGETKNSTYTELFEAQFPDRFIQVFIAEQSMIGIGQGYETYGYIPFMATFGSFFARAHDQIRMAAIGKSALRIVGSHTGVSVGHDGPAQMALEDIAFFRALPDSIVLVPCDAVSTYRCTELMAKYTQGISYMRVMRQTTPCIYNNNEEFSVGGCKVLQSVFNARALIVAAGATVHEARKAAEILQQEGIDVSIIDAYFIKPLDAKTIIAIAQTSSNRIITVEDHYLEGGLGEAVVHAVNNHSITVDILAITQLPRSGTPEALRAWLHIDADAIVAMVKKR